MNKFSELIYLLHGYNQDITIKELIKFISPFAELEKSNEELAQAYEVRNDDARDYEQNLTELEKLITTVKGGKVGEGEEGEEGEEVDEEKVEEIKKPYRLTHEERINLLGVDKELDKKITEARSKAITFAELDRKKINKLTDDYYEEHRCEETDEDSLEDDGYDRDTPEEGEEGEESEDVQQHCSKCKEVINIDDEIERQNYILFGLCKSCSSKINIKRKRYNNK